MFFWHYKLYWNYEQPDGEFSEGITFGNTFSEAVENISANYGEAEIEKITLLTPISDDCLCLEFEELRSTYKGFTISTKED